MTKPTLFLRMAAVLTFIHAVLHTIGGVFGEPGPGPAVAAVLAMKMNQFPVMGHTRSFWDFYRGLGLGVTIWLTAEAVLFWQLGSLAKTELLQLRPILATFLVAYATLAVNSYAYFFVGPVIAEILIAACLGLAIVTAKSQAAAYAGRRSRLDLKTLAVLVNYQLCSRSSPCPIQRLWMDCRLLFDDPTPGSRSRLDANAVIDGRSNPLRAAKISFSRLD